MSLDQGFFYRKQINWASLLHFLGVCAHGESIEGTFLPQFDTVSDEGSYIFGLPDIASRGDPKDGHF